MALRGITKKVRSFLLEQRQRLLTWFVARQSPSSNALLVRELEIRGQPHEIDLLGLDPSIEKLTLQVRHLGPESTLQLEGIDGLLPAETIAWPVLRSYRMTNVTLDANSGLAFQHSKVIRQSGNGHRWVRDAAFITGAFVRNEELEPFAFDGEIAWLGATNNYYHFMSECLPRLLRLREACPTIVFASVDPAPELLATIDIDLYERVLLMPRDSVVRPAALWSVDPQPLFAPHPDDLELLFRSYRRPSGDAYDQRIVVSRGKAARLETVERQLRQELEPQGFSTIDFGDLPWADQVATASSASVMVGVHGAGLTNLVFMPPGGHVIEITDGDWWWPCYRRMASARGLRYSLIRVDDTHAIDADALMRSVES